MAFTPAQRRSALGRLTQREAGAAGRVYEAALLSTCNRTELYAAVEDADVDVPWLVDVMAACAAEPRAAVEPYLYVHRDTAAARHLLRVAAGLDSMIIGEAEILGQVRQAAAEARDCGAAAGVLDALFTCGLRAGRRARAETDIGTRAASASSAAVELARGAVGDLAGRHIVLVGAGKMGVLVARALVDRGARGFVVSNRSYARAVELAETWDGCAVTFDRLLEVLADADIAIASTSAPHPVLQRDMVADVMARRPARPLTIIDIAVPRDVEPAVGSLPDVRLFDIDDLTRTIQGNLAERSAAVPRVEAILEEEAERFMREWAALEVAPTIAALRRWADGVRSREVRRALRRLGHLGERDRATVEAMAEAIVAKLLHPPIAHLKRQAGESGRYREIEAARELFGLAGGKALAPVPEVGAEAAGAALVDLRPLGETATCPNP